MTKTFFKTLLALAVTGSLAACSGGVGVENDDEATAQQRKDAQALNDRFDRVRGTYEGTFTNSDPSVPAHSARLLLYVVNVTEAANPDGSVRVRPALYSRFQLTDVVGQTDYMSMRGDFDTLGHITMSTTASTSTGSSSGASAGTSTGTTIDGVMISVTGSIGNDAVSLDVTNSGGLWGHFEGRRTTQEAAAPASSDAIELRQRLLSVYSAIEGNYAATVDTGSQRIPALLTISIAEGGTGGSTVSIPYLVAQYRRLDFPAGIGERQLAVNYDQLSGRIAMNAVAGGSGQTGGGSSAPPGSAYFVASGTWINGALDVTLRDHNGYAGELKATRKPFRD